MRTSRRSFLPLLLALALSLLPGARAADSTSSEPVAPMVGVWRWNPKDQVVTIKPDGTCTSSYNVTGQWEVSAENPLKFTIRWVNGFVDSLTVSKDGSIITGYNQYGKHPVEFKRLK
jgi:hypothetical protein